MTREEAIFCEKSYLGETKCTDCKYYGTDTCKSRESHKMAIKALLEQEFVLDEIRTEIEMEKLEDSPNFCVKAHNNAVDRVLGIIDKYKAESEK